MSYNPSNGGMFSSIAHLNSIPSEYDLVMQQQQEGYDVQADLDMFMNTQLFDFDMGTVTENNSPAAAHFGDNNDVLGMLNMEQTTNQQQQQIDYSAVPSDFDIPFATLPANNIPTSQQQPQQHKQLPQQQRRPAPLPLNLLQPHLFPQIAPAVKTSSSTMPSPAVTSLKRPAAAMEASSPSVEPTDFSLLAEDDPSRIAAEEDKRRRNTAASARFRVKKKQREAALEKSAKEMSEKLRFLEGRVGTLEMENKLLKELVTEKKGREMVEEVEKKVAQAATR